MFATESAAGLRLERSLASNVDRKYLAACLGGGAGLWEVSSVIGIFAAGGEGCLPRKVLSCALGQNKRDPKLSNRHKSKVVGQEGRA